MTHPWGDGLSAISFCVMQFRICQEKPIDKPLAVFLRHAWMVTDILFQVRECPLNEIICVGHAFHLLICEQPFEVETYSHHCRAQTLMGEYRLACDGIDGLFRQEVSPPLLLGVRFRLK